MKIKLVCRWRTNRSLSGELLINDAFECYFLTLPQGDGLPGSAIPPGKYSVMVAPSPKFQEIAKKDAWFKIYENQMPHIMGIPNRTNILIHPGNEPENTEGCILVGKDHGTDTLMYSRAAFAALQPKIAAATMDPLEGCELVMVAVNSNREAVSMAATGEQ